MINENVASAPVVFAFVNPAAGHVIPLSSVIRGFVRRGFRVRVYSCSNVSGLVREAGGEPVELDRFFTRSRSSAFAAMGYLVALDGAAFMDEFIGQELDAWKPVCTVADIDALWGLMLAEKHGLQPILFSSTQLRTLYAAGDYWGNYFRSLEPYEAALQEKLDMLAGQGFPQKTIMSLLCLDGSRDCFATISGKLQPYPETLDAGHVLFTGYSRPIGRRPEPARREGRRPLIYITLGTILNRRLRFFQNCAAAFRELDVELVMSVGSSVDLRGLEGLPPHMRAFSSVDQIDILSRADVCIFHGGMNTITECLMLGVPMVILPQTFDNFANAARVTELGAGITLRGSRPETLREAVLSVLKEPAFAAAAAALGDDMRRQCGGDGAADWIISRLR